MSKEPCLHLEGLTFRYPQSKTDNLCIKNFVLGKGERVFLYGPSGSGKSTFLNLLCGIHQVQSGKIEVLSHRLDQMSGPKRDRFRAKHIGVIFQSFNLIPFLTAHENILLVKKLSPKTFDQSFFEHICETLQIHEFANQQASRLSLGQQQRVAMARALVKRPPLVLADEPTSALDESNKQRFLDLLKDLWSHSPFSLILVGHDLSLKESFDRSMALSDLNQLPSPKTQRSHP